MTSKSHQCTTDFTKRGQGLHQFGHFLFIASELLWLNNYLHANPQNPPVPSFLVPDTRGISSHLLVEQNLILSNPPLLNKMSQAKPFLLTADKDR